jgi:DNA-binding transcriptional MerR regulator
LTRRKLGRRLGIDESKLRYWTEIGLLPRWDSVPEVVYASRLRLILHARRGGMSTQQLRRALVEAA